MLGFVFFVAVFGFMYLIYKLMANNPSENKDGTTSMRVSIANIDGVYVGIRGKLNQTAPGIFYFTDLDKDNKLLNGQFNLLHYYQNGAAGTDLVVKSAETTTKTKHGITRAVTGGVIGGVPGAVVGAATAKKVSTTKEPLTTTVRNPNNAILVLKNINSSDELSVELNLDFMRELERLNKFIKIESEFSK